MLPLSSLVLTDIICTPGQSLDSKDNDYTKARADTLEVFERKWQVVGTSCKCVEGAVRQVSVGRMKGALQPTGRGATEAAELRRRTVFPRPQESYRAGVEMMNSDHLGALSWEPVQPKRVSRLLVY